MLYLLCWPRWIWRARQRHSSGRSLAVRQLWPEGIRFLLTTSSFVPVDVHSTQPLFLALTCFSPPPPLSHVLQSLRLFFLGSLDRNEGEMTGKRI